jgi:RNA polymerase sigma factor (sigma-70 family)
MAVHDYIIKDLPDMLPKEKQATATVEQLVEGNLKLVMAIARQYAGNDIHRCQELFQEGCFGLMKAATKYKPDKGAAFSTYASWWIKQSILRHLQENHLIRVPCYLHSEKAKNNSRHKAKVEAAKHIVHINSIDEEEEFELQISDEDYIFDAFNTDTYAKLKYIIDTELTEKERFIITKRFGLDGNEPMSLEDLGNVYNLTRERIRQIQVLVLRKLRFKMRNEKNT